MKSLKLKLGQTIMLFTFKSLRGMCLCEWSAECGLLAVQVGPVVLEMFKDDRVILGLKIVEK